MGDERPRPGSASASSTPAHPPTAATAGSDLQQRFDACQLELLQLREQLRRSNAQQAQQAIQQPGITPDRTSEPSGAAAAPASSSSSNPPPVQPGPSPSLAASTAAPAAGSRPAASSAPSASPSPPPPPAAPNDWNVSELVADAGWPSSRPMEASLEELMEIGDSRGLGINVWLFSAMAPEETLQQHVQRHMIEDKCPGPTLKGSLRFMSRSAMQKMQVTSLEAAAQAVSWRWSTQATVRQEWQALLNNLLIGNYSSVVLRGVLFGVQGRFPSYPTNSIYWPVVVQDLEGSRHWGMIGQWRGASTYYRDSWGLRDLLGLKHCPVAVTTVDQASGRLLWQNSASMALYGCHGVFNTDPNLSRTTPPPLPPPPPPPQQQQQQQGSVGNEGREEPNFLVELLSSYPEAAEKLAAAVAAGGIFRARVEVLALRLRSYMGLQGDQAAHHEVQVCLSNDPIGLQKVYIISQVDVTETVLAQNLLRQAHTELAAEKLRMTSLLQRQYQLIACLGRVGKVAEIVSQSGVATELIDSVKRRMTEHLPMMGSSGEGKRSEEEVETLELLGEGSFGKVYRGLWRGTVVAVKCMVLPTHMSGKGKRECMAIMEAAISSSLSHPNIVQTYTYSLAPCRDSSGLSFVGPSAEQAQGEESPLYSSQGSSRGNEDCGLEVRLLLEFCDGGNLREALDNGCFRTRAGGINYRAVLETAADVAKGMLHLHALNVLHSDLKARNVLLRTSASEERGIMAKVSDFGLSRKMDPQQTHLSNKFYGTMTHMAPEVLLQGHQSKAVDVYAFGITLWELYTSKRPFQGIPHALLGHEITQDRRRPVFPITAPPPYVALAQSCWEVDAQARPQFEEILQRLNAMRREEGGHTPCVQVVTRETSRTDSRRPELSVEAAAAGPSSDNTTGGAGAGGAGAGGAGAGGAGTASVTGISYEGMPECDMVTYGDIPYTSRLPIAEDSHLSVNPGQGLAAVRSPLQPAPGPEAGEVEALSSSSGFPSCLRGCVLVDSVESGSREAGKPAAWKAEPKQKQQPVQPDVADQEISTTSGHPAIIMFGSECSDA